MSKRKFEDQAIDDEIRTAMNERRGLHPDRLNSSSWTDGKLHDFDRDELKRKLGRFAR